MHVLEGAGVSGGESHSFDLDTGMLCQLHEGFGPEALRAELRSAARGEGGDDGGEWADRLFAEFGRRWMERVLELGERYTDRTYEVLKEAHQRTRCLAFPFMPQRFIEIAYLGTQSFDALSIVKNSASTLTFRVPSCHYYAVIREEQGDGFARELHCRYGCLTACQAAFGHFGFDVCCELDATMPGNGFCQFSIRRA